MYVKKDVRERRVDWGEERRGYKSQKRGDRGRATVLPCDGEGPATLLCIASIRAWAVDCCVVAMVPPNRNGGGKAPAAGSQAATYFLTLSIRLILVGPASLYRHAHPHSEAPEVGRGRCHPGSRGWSSSLTLLRATFVHRDGTVDLDSCIRLLGMGRSALVRSPGGMLADGPAPPQAGIKCGLTVAGGGQEPTTAQASASLLSMVVCLRNAGVGV